VCVSLSLAFSLSLFFDRYKNGTPCAPTLASRCLVSFVPFSARFGFALRAFNLFAPSPCTSLCIWVCICVCVRVRFALCMSAIDSLQTHTRMRACTHTHTYRRWWEERHTEKVGGRMTTGERERRSPYIMAHKMTVMLPARWMTVGREGPKIRSRISFRSDDDNDDVSSSSISTQLRRYDFFSLYLSFTARIPIFFPYRYNNYYNFDRFLCQHMNVYMCACISRDRENVLCFTAVDGRSVDLVRVFMCVCVCVSSL
jgi:hypothetical protein